MSNRSKKISELDALETSSNDDLIPIVDNADSTTKKQTKQNLLKEVQQSADDAQEDIDSHILDKNNPHEVTKEQIGLGNIDNTSDADKPISEDTQNALDDKTNESDFTSHTGNTENPHSVTKTQVGLGNVDNTSDANKPVSSAQQSALDLKINNTEKGANNGVAQLDAGGKVPANQLPNTVMEYKGSWNPVTNTPAIADGTGDAGDVWLVSVDGSIDLGHGVIDFAEGDWVIYNGTIWEKSINSNKVVSVNGQQGVVSLDADDIDDTSTTKKFTNTIEKSYWNDKQEALESATNIKTINSNNLLGPGDITVATLIGYTPYDATNPSNFITLTALSSSVTALLYTNTNGVFSLKNGYIIPTTTQETNWNTAYSNTHTHSNTIALNAVSGTNTGDDAVNSLYSGLVTMTYPGVGIALSTGSAWGTSITNNSANWNTAYGWGNHASVGYVTGTPWTAMGYYIGNGSAFATSAQGALADTALQSIPDNYLLNTGDTATGNYTFDTNTLFIDAINHRVGIGKINPAYILDVYNGASTLNLQSANLVLEHDTGNAFDSQSGLTRSTVGTASASGGYWYAKDASGATTALIRSYAPSGVQGYFTAGNIGIGTATPNTSLEVSLNGGAIIRLSHLGAISTANESLGKLEYYNDDASASYGVLASIRAETNAGFDGTTTNGANLIFATKTLASGLVDRMTILAGGNIGIGTTSPNEILHLYRNDDAITDTSLKIENTKITAESRIVFRTSSADAQITLNFPNRQLAMFTQDADDISIYTFNNPNQLFLDQGTGNVGIGTNAPIYNLDVLQEMGIYGATSTSRDFYFSTTDTTAGLRWILRTNGTAETGSNVGSDFSIHSRADDGTALLTPLFIRRSTGYVGIGNTDPTSDLHIVNVDNARIHVSGGANDDASLKLTEAGDTGFDFTYDGGDNKLYIKTGVTGTYATKLTIDRTTGYLGVGQTTVDVALDILGDIKLGEKAGGSQSNSLRFNRLASTDSLNFIFEEADVAKAGIGLRGNTDGLSFSIGSLIAGNTKMYLDTTGYFGIGTTAPGDLLEVYKSANASVQISGWNSTNTDIDGLIPGTSAGGLIKGGTNSHLVFGLRENDADDGFYFISGGGNWMTDSVYDTMIMSVKAEGKVGIGTTAPTAVLHLKAGTATANTAPLKFTSGTLNTIAVAGQMEYNNTFHLTNSDNTRRHIVLGPNTTKVIAGAPYANDGYVVMNIGSTDFKVMTTA